MGSAAEKRTPQNGQSGYRMMPARAACTVRDMHERQQELAYMTGSIVPVQHYVNANTCAERNQAGTVRQRLCARSYTYTRGHIY